MTKTEEEEEKTIKMVVMEIACEVEAVEGDEGHVRVTPLHHHYTIRKPEEKEGLTKDIRVRKSVHSLLENIGHEVMVATGRRAIPDEILFAHRLLLGPKAVLEMRKLAEERRRGVPVGEKGERKTLLEAAIEDKEEREKGEVRTQISGIGGDEVGK